MLWEAGFRASGMDLAPTAVEMALRHRVPPGDHDRCGGEPCFKQGSAAAIPWPDQSFDAIMSTDVLEHIPPGLVPQVALEFARVAREHLFLAVKCKEEVRKKYINRLSGNVVQAHALHETVQTAQWWKARFEQTGAWRCTFSQLLIKGKLGEKWKKRAQEQDPSRPRIALDDQGNPADNFRMFCTSRKIFNHVH